MGLLALLYLQTACPDGFVLHWIFIIFAFVLVSFRIVHFLHLFLSLVLSAFQNRLLTLYALMNYYHRRRGSFYSTMARRDESFNTYYVLISWPQVSDERFIWMMDLYGSIGYID